MLFSRCVYRSPLDGDILNPKQLNDLFRLIDLTFRFHQILEALLRFQAILESPYGFHR